MKRSCSLEDLEALVEGGLSPEDAVELNSHAAECASCGEELRWLRTERELMRRRAARAPLPPAELDSLWSGVSARLVEKRPARAWWRPMGFSTAVAAAAVLAFIAGRHAADKEQHTTPIEVSQAPPAARFSPVSAKTVDPDTRQVLDEAEAEWRSAAGELEQRYMEERTQLRKMEAARIDRSLARTRRSIAEARALAGTDVQARLAVLNGYSDYVHSLHSLVSDLEVSR